MIQSDNHILRILDTIYTFRTVNLSKEGHKHVLYFNVNFTIELQLSRRSCQSSVKCFKAYTTAEQHPWPEQAKYFLLSRACVRKVRYQYSKQLCRFKWVSFLIMADKKDKRATNGNANGKFKEKKSSQVRWREKRLSPSQEYNEHHRPEMKSTQS